MIAGLEHNSIILTPNLLMENVSLLQSPNVYKSCPKMNSLEKWIILTPLQKLHYNVGDLGKIIVATSFECLPKVQKIDKSGYTGLLLPLLRDLTWGI